MVDLESLIKTTKDGKKYFETDWVYDLESYPNIFTMTLIHTSGKWLKTFEISDRKNQTEELANCLRYLVKQKARMVGFNNLGYDYQLIHAIIEKLAFAKRNGQIAEIKAEHMYALTEQIISAMKDDGRVYGVRESEHFIKQVDLFKVKHFDNKARSTSLKMLEVNMRSPKVEDLPFPVGIELNDDQKDVLCFYNQHDVMETLKFYYYCHEDLKLRVELSDKFGFDCTNYNDTKIGKELFIQTLEKEQPGICYTVNPKGGRRIRQTKRSEIVIADCLFPYIKFKRPEFQAIHEWFKKQVITETVGVFSDILEHELGDVAKYAAMVVKRKKINNPDDAKDKKYVPTQDHLNLLKQEQPMGWVEEKELKSPKGAKSYYWCYRIAETLNVVIDDFRFDFGVGGIHGAEQGTLTTGGGKVIRTLDVASYYPNMAISNNVYPAHLGITFCKVYKDLYIERKSHPKGSAANAALKLALNGTYGDSNNEFSPLYDPQYTMTITIGGQLSLCMLMEEIINIGGRIIMCNTDGFEYVIDEELIPQADALVKEWETVTGLEMEGDTYAKMFIRDVNNYISVTTSGKVKTKGAYEVMPYEQLGWHKNHSAMIIPVAVHDYLIKGIPVEQTIMECKNPFDFMLRTKVPRSSRLVMEVDGVDVPQQNICRYYPSTDGGKLVKIMPPLQRGEPERRLGIDTSWNVKTCNDIDSFEWDIDYNYYLQAAKDLVDAVSLDANLKSPF